MWLPIHPSIKNTSDLNKVIRESKGNSAVITDYVRRAVDKSPISMFVVPTTLRYLTAEGQRSGARTVIEWSEPNWLRYVPQMREILTDEEIREMALEIYRKSPWFFYNHKDAIEKIFPNEWFRKLQHDWINLQSSEFWKIFLLFNWHSLPESFGSPFDKIMNKSMEWISEEEVNLLGAKEPWFACGGMEKNFLEAASNKKWICLVNGLFHAKYYHRRSDPAKVAYLPTKRFKTRNGYIIWEDYFYSPSHGQHDAIIKAIEKWEPNITVPDLVVKAVRPSIGLTSAWINQKIRT